MSLILLVPNERLPRKAQPASGPGLRALHLAIGLSENGHDVVVVVPALPKDLSENSPRLGPMLFEGIVEIPVSLERLPDFIGVRRPDVVIFTNYINYQYILWRGERIDFGRTKIIYDFFAPRVLEQHAGRQLGEAELRSESERKCAALRASDAILLNGPRKAGYVTSWLTMAGASLETPVVQAPFCVPVAPRPEKREPRKKADRKIVVSGNRHAWAESGLSVIDLLPKVQDLNWSILHIGTPKFSLLDEARRSYLTWYKNGAIESYESLDLSEFISVLQQADIALDIFQPTRERELAYITRTAVALSIGLPVIHPRNTELGDVVHATGAGWTYDSENEIFAILDWISAHPADFAKRTERAQNLARTRLNPRASTAEAANLVRALARAPQLRRRAETPRDAHPARWYSRLICTEWCVRRYGIDWADGDRTHSPDDMFCGLQRTKKNVFPNFLFEEVCIRRNVDSILDLSEDDGREILRLFFDADWYSEAYGVDHDIVACAEHYFKFAASSSLSPSPYFCENLYLELYPATKDAVHNRIFFNGFHHFLAHGLENGASCTILFDEEYFCSRHPEAADANGNTEFDSPYYHFLKSGLRGKISATPLFDPIYYARRYSGVVDGSRSHDDLLLDFVRTGLPSGRFGSKFHKDLVTRELVAPPLKKYVARAGRALDELGRGHRGYDDLAVRLQSHINKVHKQFVDDVAIRLSWLKHLNFYTF